MRRLFQQSVFTVGAFGAFVFPLSANALTLDWSRTGLWDSSGSVRTVSISRKLAGCNGCDLSGANITNTQFFGNFHNIKISGSKMRHSDLRGAKFSNSNFDRTDVSESRFASNMANSSFVGATLRNVDATGSNLYASNFAGAAIEGAGFTGADLRFSNLTSVKARGAEFTNSNLSGSRIDDSDFSNADFNGSTLKGIRARKTNFYKSTLHNANLSSADLSLAMGINRSQLTGACGDAYTKLPDGLTIPFCKRK